METKEEVKCKPALQKQQVRLALRDGDLAEAQTISQTHSPHLLKPGVEEILRQQSSKRRCCIFTGVLSTDR